MAKSKTRMISVRVSEDDYRLLKARYEVYGSRSMSALAREAIANIVDGLRHQPGDLEAELGLLTTRLSDLQRLVARIALLVDSGAAPEQPAD